MRRGELRVSTHQWHNKVHCMKGCVANSMLWPCGLGCHMLGPSHIACLGTTLSTTTCFERDHTEAQRLAHTGQVRMTAQKPPATYQVLLLTVIWYCCFF